MDFNPNESNGSFREVPLLQQTNLIHQHFDAKENGWARDAMSYVEMK
ncbi:MAG: hypothetical protein QGH39_08705 [Candidatus Thermoplasmatota archaeon]|jgi:hypothetical protein|nr:hypothetical protein [Candidatus Thermoplasmatota archaeon]MDP7265623.1 hypothetical protein [Candidatus Thermoplasmatota archaeon]